MQPIQKARMSVNYTLLHCLIFKLIKNPIMYILVKTDSLGMHFQILTVK